MLPDEFHFLRPLWLLLLLALPPLWWLLSRQRRGAGDWRQACDAHLLPHLLESGPGGSGMGRRLLAMAALALASLALAGPAWERQPEALQRQEAALVIALDLSPAVRAADLKPDRLTRARFKLADLLRLRPDGQLALVVYAGDAFTVAPLTDDANTIANLIDALDPGLMPVAGQRADRALRHAERLLRGAGHARGEVLLITDRVDARDTEAAARLAAAGIRVSVLGLGAASGAPVPLPGGGFATDAQGRPLLARLDTASLSALARAGGGRFAAIGSDDGDLRALGLDSVVAENLREVEGQALRYRDAGWWLLPPLMLLMLLGFRRGWLALLVVMPLGAPPAQAFEWRDLWQRPDQQAAAALAEGDAQRAQALARDPALRGAAAYRAEAFEQAIADFAQGESASARYNLGNALARAGRFEEALAAYDEALQRDPQLADAEANREAVRRWLEQQAQQQDQQQQGQGEGDPSEGEQPSGGQEGEEQASPEDGEASAEPQAGDESGAEGEQREQDGAEAGEGGDAQDSTRPGSESDASDDPGAEPGEQDAAEPEALGDEAQQSLSQAIDQALAEREGEEAAMAEAAVDPAERAQDERRQSVEQWLRRVPDDPGALLRRKFALEHQRRQREGGGEE